MPVGELPNASGEGRPASLLPGRCPRSASAEACVDACDMTFPSGEAPSANGPPASEPLPPAGEGAATIGDMSLGAAPLPCRAAWPLSAAASAMLGEQPTGAMRCCAAEEGVVRWNSVLPIAADGSPDPRLLCTEVRQSGQCQAHHSTRSSRRSLRKIAHFHPITH